MFVVFNIWMRDYNNISIEAYHSNARHYISVFHQPILMILSILFSSVNVHGLLSYVAVLDPVR